MNINTIKTALQDLITRLQDAEMGYKKIEEKTEQIGFNEWMGNLASERHRQHQLLENEISKLNGHPDVSTSLLGDLHRLFINFKIEHIDDSLDAIIEEIERGNAILLEDLDKVLNQVALPLTIRDVVMKIRSEVASERMKLSEFREMYTAVAAH